MSSLCPYFQNGCCSEFALDATPALFHEAASYFKKQGLDLHLLRGSPTKFRTRAKLAVRKEGIGLFKKGTHNISETPNCIVHHPKINEAIAFFKKAFNKSGFSSYDEVTHRGDLRYIQCVVERSSETVQLSLVLNGAHLLPEWKAWCEKTLQTPLIHSVWLNIQPAKTNVIFSDEWIPIFGPVCIWETISGVDIPFGPSHFGQGNLELFEALLFDLKTHIKPESSVLETYAGVGVIGLAIAESCSSVMLSEREKSAEAYFLKAKEKLPLSVQQKLTFQVAASEETTELLNRSDTVIVDPPRKGVDPKFLEAVSNSSVETVIYISCHFPSFERDAEILLKSGFKTVFAKSYLFFPGTNHIELLAIFERKN